MAKLIIPVIPVARSVMERLAKARANLVQKKVPVKTRRGTHYRMQWVKPENDVAGVGRGQQDLFDDNSQYKPKHPDKGEFVGDGVGDNGRPYEGYRTKDGVKYYDTETGRELDEDGNMTGGDDGWSGDMKALPAFIESIESRLNSARSSFGMGGHKKPDFPQMEVTINGKAYLYRDGAPNVPHDKGGGKGVIQLQELKNGKMGMSDNTLNFPEDFPAGAKIQATSIKPTSEFKEGKKPFDDMTFPAKKSTGKPENVAETVRAVLDMSSGSASQFADKAKIDDIDAFQHEAAKWAYENDKIGTGFDILDQYARHKGLRKSMFEMFKDGLAKAFGAGK